jgi:ADP-ribose pyrophosphatase
MPIEYLNSEPIYEGRAFKVQRDTVRLPDGRVHHFDVVEHVPAVTLVPVDQAGKMYFVRQYRSGLRDMLLELPAGVLNSGEEPEVCALREVREEIGMAAGKIEAIGEVYLSPGYSTEYMYFYLATELYASPLEHDEDEFLDIEAIPVDQAYAMAEAGSLKDGKTLAALLLARPRLKDLFPELIK